MSTNSNGTGDQPRPAPLPSPDDVKPISPDIFIVEKKGLDSPQPVEQR